MTHRRGHSSRTLALIAAAAIFGGACFHRGVRVAPPLQVSRPVQEIVSPQSNTTRPLLGSIIDSISGATETYIESMRLDNADVRLVLQKIAEIGKLDLVIPGEIRKTISVRYVHVPVSVALGDVLARSGLQLGSGPPRSVPFDTVTVFYRLPANVDSLSVDAIMSRFGVGRGLAELLVQSRRP